MKAVHENESFSSMTAAQIYGRAGGRKLKSGNTGNPWTEEEDEALKEYILMPTEKRPSFAQYCKRLTRHSQASAYTRYKKMEKEIKQ